MHACARPFWKQYLCTKAFRIKLYLLAHYWKCRSWTSACVHAACVNVHAKTQTAFMDMGLAHTCQRSLDACVHTYIAKLHAHTNFPNVFVWVFCSCALIPKGFAHVSCLTKALFLMYACCVMCIDVISESTLLMSGRHSIRRALISIGLAGPHVYLMRFHPSWQPSL